MSVKQIMGTELRPELVLVRLAQIFGQEKESKAFLRKCEYETDTALDAESWNRETLQFLYLLSPMVLIARGNGFEYLGSGRAFQLAQEIFVKGESIPALLIKGTRIKRETKLQVLAADLFGFPALNRTRRFVPRTLYLIWKELGKAGVAAIVGATAKDFSRATGYSVKSLIRPKNGRIGDATETACLTAPDLDSTDQPNDFSGTT